MILYYENKKSKELILQQEAEGISKLQHCDGSKDSKNVLIQGENLVAMKSLLLNYGMANSIDLVYIDPPFSTNNVFKIGKSRANTISSSNHDETAYTDKLKGADFIEFLRERLIVLRELMSPTSSIYLHIDYKIGHYVKIIMDEIFGAQHFRNDITRVKCNPKNFKRKSYSNIKDMILFYTKTDKYTWNEPHARFTESEIIRLFSKVDKNGRRYTTVPLHAPGETNDGATGQPWRDMKPPIGRHWRSEPAVLEQLDKDGLIEWSKNGNPRKIIYADESEGKRIQDIWEFKDPQYPKYPTEKNVDLLEQIITTSSNPKDIVLDCFSGSGTTLISSNNLDRNWIGIDQSEKAIQITRKRFSEAELSLYTSNDDYKFLELQDRKNSITV